MTIPEACRTIFFFLALTVVAAGQEIQTLAPQDNTPPHAIIPTQDSTSAEPAILPPLSLTPLYRESPPFFTASPELPSGFNNWSREARRPIPLSFQLLNEAPPYSFSQPNGGLFRPGPWMLQSKTDLMSPWKLQLRSQEKYQIWQSILGSVELGGLAYMTYLHFKKYGLR